MKLMAKLSLRLVFTVVVTPLFLAQNAHGVPNKSLMLRNYSISRNLPSSTVASANNSKFLPQNALLEERSCSTSIGHRWPQYVELKRQGTSNVVAIVAYEPGSPAELNPIGFDYGPIPTLRDITPGVANNLWGTQTSSGSIHEIQNEITFKLFSSGGAQEFLVDLIFQHGRLRKYRVRSKMFDRFDELAQQGKLEDWHAI